MAKSKYARPWKPKPKIRVSRHDHVNSMIFTDESAACRVCGQCWDRGSYGWVALPYGGTH